MATQYTYPKITPGQSFDHWTVISEATRDKHSNMRWFCRCACGKEHVVLAFTLLTGVSKSCGCLARQLRVERAAKHHMANTDVYHVWEAMVQRVTNPKNVRFADYGGRGITICSRWRAAFADFFADIGPRPEKGYSIERIDNDGNYEPGNVKWATRQEQQNNTRGHPLVEFQGRKQTKRMWERELGLKKGAVKTRLSRGWTINDALTTRKGEKR